MTPEALTEYWDKVWQKYFATNPEALWVQNDTPPLPNDLQFPSELVVGKRVIDLGCGYGKLGRDIAHHCAWYCGMDVSEAALEMARQLCPAKNAEFHNASLFTFVSMPVDTILCRDVFIHLTRKTVAKYTSHFRRILPPGGKVWCNFYPKGGSAWRAVPNDSRECPGDRVVPYTLDEIYELLAGFDLDVQATGHRYIVTAGRV